jgi:hypothetical protein
MFCILSCTYVFVLLVCFVIFNVLYMILYICFCINKTWTHYKTNGDKNESNIVLSRNCTGLHNTQLNTRRYFCHLLLRDFCSVWFSIKNKNTYLNWKMPFINQMTKQTNNTKNIYVHKMYKMIYKTLKMTKQTSNTKTYIYVIIYVY